jgi:sec-independent protein translocase protein TatA
MNFGAPEMIIVLLVVLLLFGGAKLPQLARSLGQAKKEFQEGVAEQPGSAAPPASPERPLRKKPSDT